MTADLVTRGNTSTWDKALRKVLQLFPYLLVLCLLLIHLHPLLSNRLLSSWDLPVHYYLSHRMLENVRAGNLVAYNVQWFGGYGEFTVYGPLSYIIPALIHGLSLGTLSLDWCFNFSLALLVISFFCCFVYCGESFLGREARWWLVLCTFWFLSYPKEQFGHFLGLFGLLKAGVVPNYWALCFFLLGLGGFRRSFEGSRSGLTMYALSFPLMLFTHLLTFTIGTALLSIYGLLNARRLNLAHLYAPALAMLPLIPWLLQFLSHLEYSSITAVPTAERPVHPLLVLFPGLSVTNLQSLWYQFLDSKQAWLPRLAQTCFEMPALGILLLFSCGVSLISTFQRPHKGQRELVITIIVGMLLLSSDFILQFVGIPFRPYRSVQLLALPLLILCAHGLITCWSHVSKSFLQRSMLLMGIAFPSALVWLVQLDLHYLSGRWDAKKSPTYLDQSAEYQSALSLAARLQTLAPRGRVAIEQNEALGDSLGSPRALSALLPLLASVNVLQGTPEEAAGNADFLFAPTLIGSEQMSWAAGQFSRYSRFSQQSAEDLSWRLSQLGVEYLISTSVKYRSFLDTLSIDSITKDGDFGSFSLYRITDPCPAVYYPRVKPWLYLETGAGMTFRNFSRLIYAESPWFKLPLIRLKRVDDLESFSRATVGGLFISAPTSEIFAEIKSTLPAVWQEIPMLPWLGRYPKEIEPSNEIGVQLGQLLAPLRQDLEQLPIDEYCPPSPSTETDLGFSIYGFSPLLRQGCGNVFESQLGLSTAPRSLSPASSCPISLAR